MVINSTMFGSPAPRIGPHHDPPGNLRVLSAGLWVRPVSVPGEAPGERAGPADCATVRATDAVREQIRLLHADWTLLNQPDRLQKLADQFLALKTTNPAQFMSMADLDARVPLMPEPEVPVSC